MTRYASNVASSRPAEPIRERPGSVLGCSPGPLGALQHDLDQQVERELPRLPVRLVEVRREVGGQRVDQRVPHHRVVLVPHAVADVPRTQFVGPRLEPREPGQRDCQRTELEDEPVHLVAHVHREQRPQLRVPGEQQRVELLRQVGVGADPRGGAGDPLDVLRCHGLSSMAVRSWARLLTPSLAKIRCRWLSTVRTESTRAAATSLLDRPCATSRAISRSRDVSTVAVSAIVARSAGVTASATAARRAAACRASAWARRGSPERRAAATAVAPASAAASSSPRSANRSATPASASPSAATAAAACSAYARTIGESHRSAYPSRSSATTAGRPSRTCS